MGAATRTRNVHHLVLYEPSLGLAYPPGSIDAIEDAVARGDREGAIVAVLRDILDMTEDEIDALRSGPLWPVRLAAAHTVPRECRVEDAWVYAPGPFDRITAPTLLLAGSDSVTEITRATIQAAAAIPDAQIRVLDGHGHLAHKTDPAMVDALIRDFIRS
jgi:pimeloyl-ACP methyl ester carboxylesterase